MENFGSGINIPVPRHWNKAASQVAPGEASRLPERTPIFSKRQTFLLAIFVFPLQNWLLIKK
jgi:hypothetical protein